MSGNIGNKIKQLREAAHLTPEALAEAACITPEQVALIENEGKIPAISTLIKFARAIGVRLGTLLDGAEQTGPIVTEAAARHRTVSVTSNSNKNINNLDFFSLAEGKADRNMEPYVVNVGHSTADAANRSQHEGEEFLYVLDGKVTVYYGQQSYTLGEGDSIYYDSIVPHCISSQAENATAKVLAVTFTPY